MCDSSLKIGHAWLMSSRKNIGECLLRPRSGNPATGQDTTNKSHHWLGLMRNTQMSQGKAQDKVLCLTGCRGRSGYSRLWPISGGLPIPQGAHQVPDCQPSTGHDRALDGLGLRLLCVVFLLHQPGCLHAAEAAPAGAQAGTPHGQSAGMRAPFIPPGF